MAAATAAPAPEPTGGAGLLTASAGVALGLRAPVDPVRQGSPGYGEHRGGSRLRAAAAARGGRRLLLAQQDGRGRTGLLRPAWPASA